MTLRSVQMCVATLSVIVLATTGYAWGTLREFTSSISGDLRINNERDSPDGATDILLVGKDSRTDAQGNPLPDEVLRKLRASDAGGHLTDTMILLRIPDDGEHARAVSFPRDTMVDMGEFGTNKLNSALNRKRVATLRELKAEGVTDERKLARESRIAGQQFLMDTIEDFAGVSIDHYAEVNLLGFYKLTQVVGGVKVCLKNPVDDPNSGADFPAGTQTISGADALAFVRQRHGLPRGDLDRIVRQQVFMSGLARKMLSAGTLGNHAKLRELMNALGDSVLLDKDWDVLDFATRMQDIAAGDITFETIPVEMTGPSSGLAADPSEVRRFVDNLLLPPEEREAARREAERAEQLRAETEVNVYNASGVSGLAGRVRDDLDEDGFERGAAANAERMREESVIRYSSDREAAELVSEELGGITVEQSSQPEPGTVSVYLGDDYQGPGARKFTGTGGVRLDGRTTNRALGTHGDGSEQLGDGKSITADGVPCVN
ncbi:LCP family protein [Actinopolyspora mortivallis]|uniref:LytR family transcriptional regulator n=1 Tax=Actinopolyspora mortivallis TaxID=33906 RepID=A0A2T0GU58_ACTMO|nr:LCP family protein [Actinopolyspora mortivallis]PRW62656.1 LytR family transcriptional regulator [Actinopolyspora mortivallis]